MKKFRTMFFTLMAAGVLLSLSSATANAQRPNPSAQSVANARQNGPCRDPWISIAFWDKNGGSWSSYDQLYKVVEPTINFLHNNGYSFKVLSDGSVGGTTSVLMLQNGIVQAQQTISNSLIGQDGAGIARVIAQGGGNIVSHSGGTFQVGSSILATRNGDVFGILVNGGGSIVINNGANIRQLRGFSFSPGDRGVQSSGSIRLPKSSLVIR